MQQGQTKPGALLECDEHDLKVLWVVVATSKVRAMKLRLALHVCRKTANSSDGHLWGVTPSPATPFAERGRVLVVAKERKYRTYHLDNKMLTSAEHMV